MLEHRILFDEAAIATRVSELAAALRRDVPDVALVVIGLLTGGVVFAADLIRAPAKGRFRGEHVYRALGETTAGRRLAVFFIHKRTGNALVLSARDMDRKERRSYVSKCHTPAPQRPVAGELRDTG